NAQTDQFPALPSWTGPDPAEDQTELESEQEQTNRHGVMASVSLLADAQAAALAARVAGLEEELARALARSADLAQQLVDRDARLALLASEVERRRNAEQGLQTDLAAARSATHAASAGAALHEAEIAAARNELANTKAQALEDAAARARE